MAANPFDKYGAEDAVRRVAGVNTVANDIIVRPASCACVPGLR